MTNTVNYEFLPAHILEGRLAAQSYIMGKLFDNSMLSKFQVDVNILAQSETIN